MLAAIAPPVDGSMWYATPQECWQNKSSVGRCQFQDCGQVFTYFTSKNNCFRCGIVLCKSCIVNKVMDGLFGNGAVPVCPRCAIIIDGVVKRQQRAANKKRTEHFYSAGYSRSEAGVPTNPADPATPQMKPPAEDNAAENHKSAPAPSTSELIFSSPLAALSSVTSAAAAVLLSSAPETEAESSEDRAESSATESRDEATIIAAKGSLRAMLQEEIERGALRQKTYQQDVNTLVNEKMALTRQNEELRRRLKLTAAEGLCLLPLEDPSTSMEVSTPEALSESEKADIVSIKAERHRLRESISILQLQLKRERTRKTELEARFGEGSGHDGVPLAEQHYMARSPEPSPEPQRQETNDAPSSAADGVGAPPEDVGMRSPSWDTVHVPRIPLTGPSTPSVSAPGIICAVQDRSFTPESREAQLTRWAEELYEKAEVLEQMLDHIRTYETQLRDFADRLRRRSDELMELHLPFLREERLILLSEEADEQMMNAG